MNNIKFKTLHIQGEKGCKNKINEKPRFNVLVSENCISKDNVSEIETFILTHTEALNYLKLRNVHKITPD